MTREGDSEPSIDSLLREAAHIPSIAVEPDRIGRRLDRYRIDEKLGQGGMGIVYAAHDLELGRSVALKILPLSALADDERRRRFLREARTAAAVSHVNLAAVYDVGEADGTVFLAMELIRGTSLRAKITAAPKGLAVADAVAIATQIARGVGKAHACGVVHRDLKPENVMLDASGQVKVVDFGLAKPAGGEGRAEGELSTQEGRILGTPSYMAPEQAKGMRVSAAADVFSIGVILFELLTGERPFVGESLVDIVVAIARDAPGAPSKRAPHVPRQLDDVVQRCLAKAPAARYADGNALADALELRPASHARHGRRTWFAVAAGALAIAGAAGVLGTPRRAGTPSTSPSGAANASPIEPVAAVEPRSVAPTSIAAAPVSAALTALPPPPAPRSHGTPARSSVPVEPAISARRPASVDSRPPVDPLARQK